MIDILLTTYNGEKYLSEQIDSILSQTFTDWRLLIRDDGSSDSTTQIINTYHDKHPQKIIFLSDDEGNLGLTKSFSKLMSQSDAEYIAFCDQDDVWMEYKLELQIQEITKAEKKFGSDIPILIHTDLKVVNKDLEIISESFWKYQKLNPYKMNKLNVLVLQNFVTGCSSLINRALVNAAQPIEDNAIIHDWWIALVAVLYGKIITIDRASLYYRQHDTNDTGATKWSMSFIIKKMMEGNHTIQSALLKTKSQCQDLCHLPDISREKKKLIEAYIDLYGKNYIERRVFLIKYKFSKYGFVRNLGMYLLI